MSGSNRETILKEMFNNQKLKKWSGDGGIALTHTQHISQSEPAKRLLAGRAEGNSKEGANGTQDKVQSSWHLKSDLAVVGRSVLGSNILSQNLHEICNTAGNSDQETKQEKLN